MKISRVWILGVLISLTAMGAEQKTHTIKVTATIDGVSHLYVTSHSSYTDDNYGGKPGVTLAWNHLLWEFPKSVSVNGKEWALKAPDVPGLDMRSGSPRNFFPFGNSPSLISDRLETDFPEFESLIATDYKVIRKSGRAEVKIVQYPKNIPYIYPNVYLVIEVSDPDDGSEEVTFELNYPVTEAGGQKPKPKK